MPGRWNLPEISQLLRLKKQVAELGPQEVNRALLNQCGFANAPMRDKLSSIEKKRVLLARGVLSDAEFTELRNSLCDERTFVQARKKLDEDFAEIF